LNRKINPYSRHSSRNIGMMATSKNTTQQQQQRQQQQQQHQNSRYGAEAKNKIISASIGSIITALTVTPLEVVKVRQQAAGLTSATTSALNINLTSLPKLCPNGCGTFVLSTGLGEYLTSRSKAGCFDPKTGILKQKQREIITEASKTGGGPLKIIRKIFLTEGFSGIYAGLAPTLVMGIPNTVLYFFSYEEISPRLKERYPSDHPVSGAVPAVAGGSARFLASLTTAPLELLRTQQAARAGGSLGDSTAGGGGMIAELRTMVRSDGALSLFRGAWPTLMRDVPFSAIYWVCIESMRDFWRNRHRDQQHLSNNNNDILSSSSSSISNIEQTVEALISGCVSGIIAAAFTTPLDVLKTRSQVVVIPATTVTKATTVESIVGESSTVICDHGGALAVNSKGVPLISTTTASSTTSGGSSVTTKSLPALQIARNIVETEGISGLWRGNTARCMKVAPACGIMISTYEAGKRLLATE
jgi:solute carrier family 25 protein 39/40